MRLFISFWEETFGRRYKVIARRSGNIVVTEMYVKGHRFYEPYNYDVKLTGGFLGHDSVAEGLRDAAEEILSKNPRLRVVKLKTRAKPSRIDSNLHLVF